MRRDRGLDGVVIQPYRGYGSRDEIYLMGRVFQQPRMGSGLPGGSFLREVADVLRRFGRWGLGGATIRARIGAVEGTFETDGDGYFHVQLHPDGALDDGARWHTVSLDVTHDGDTASEEGLVYVPPASARYVVISDIDDTVMHTGVANKAKMLWRLFVQGAESRVAFPGVAELYQALHAGVGGDEGNPMLYVSRAPWSIYEVLATFFRLKGIPEGPILFLREWGLTLQRPLPRKAKDHKRDLIREMLRRYPQLPFILIGDSGQHDPEIYAQVVRENPDRVKAVYIRDVDPDPERRDQVLELAGALEKAGSALVLTDRSDVMAEHAREIGLIA
ncbi:MAG: phosphatase domain-containing protein [Longimicrobiales bacterium]|nr:phosphatase domain-containing protein [Longimicrobiales bacterium]